MTLTAAIPLAYRPDAADRGRDRDRHGIDDAHAARLERAALGRDHRDRAGDGRGVAAVSRRAIPTPSPIRAAASSSTTRRSFFSTHNRKYDIIISEPSNPWVSGVSSLFTCEFYRMVRRHLNQDGILVQWFQMYEIDASLVASVLRALGENFPDYAVYASTGSDLLIVAGEARTLARPLADVLATMPGVARELRRVQVNSIRDIEVRRIGGKSSLAPMFASYDVPANSDYYPYLDLHAAKYRFLHQSADQLTGLLAYSVPVVALLEGRKSAPADPKAEGQEYLEALELARRAAYARDYLLSPEPPRARRDPAPVPEGPRAHRACASSNAATWAAPTSGFIPSTSWRASSIRCSRPRRRKRSGIESSGPLQRSA